MNYKILLKYVYYEKYTELQLVVVIFINKNISFAYIFYKVL